MENTPKKLIFRVPALADGTYTLKVVTRFSVSQRLLNEPRTITYELPLTNVRASYKAGNNQGADAVILN
ncbi:MAG: DUF4469 domain-containing protein [Treponema sp.]|nr:DUF4469 domain-containing protein [Treponema sp.]